jgi:hypothetical protein
MAPRFSGKLRRQLLGKKRAYGLFSEVAGGRIVVAALLDLRQDQVRRLFLPGAMDTYCRRLNEQSWTQRLAASRKLFSATAAKQEIPKRCLSA